MTKQELIKILDEKINDVEQEPSSNNVWWYKLGQLNLLSELKNLLENEVLDNYGK